MSRSVLLGKIRHACRLSAGSISEELTLPTQLPDFPHYEDPIATFREELELIGGVFLDGRGESQLKQALATVLEQTQTTEIYWEGKDIFRKHHIPYTLRNREAFQQGDLVNSSHFHAQVKLPLILNSRPYQRQSLGQVQLSASSAFGAVAETASIIHQVESGTGRLLSVLPPAHIVLLAEKDLLMNHRQLFESYRFGEYGSATTLISGPSRTADIEKTLVLGVHGPQHWHVILTAP